MDCKCCWNCTAYNGTYCTRQWKDYDYKYLVKERDEKRPDDICEHYDKNEEYWNDEE